MKTYAVHLTPTEWLRATAALRYAAGRHFIIADSLESTLAQLKALAPQIEADGWTPLLEADNDQLDAAVRDAVGEPTEEGEF